jgi:parallel beta-helix repeat protein
MKTDAIKQSKYALKLIFCAVFLSACGGGAGNSEPTVTTASPAPAPAPVPAWQQCSKIPDLPAASTIKQVRDFGAVPDDAVDDSSAIQTALNSLKPGEALQFPAGRYLINKSLKVTQPGSSLVGNNATIHATNADDQALLIQADNVTVTGFTFTAVTDVRRTAPWHARIAVYAPDSSVAGGYRTVRNTTIRGNRIINAGAPGTSLANSASSNGVFLYRADGFLVAENTVLRSLADGIHITSGSRNGRVLNNTVRESGDDMIAVVSYAGTGTAALGSASSLAQNLGERMERQLSRNILIAGNEVSGQYWGRGISVVGGQSVTAANNTVTNVPLAAAFIVARETSYETFGVDNVLIEANTVRDVQNLNPPYNPSNIFDPAKRTSHGAVEIHSSLFSDEAASAALRPVLSVRNVLVRNNYFERANVNAVRAGVNIEGVLNATNAQGQSVSRAYARGDIEGVSVQANQFNQISKEPLNAIAHSANLHCAANQRDGQAYASTPCKAAAEPSVQGMTLSCDAAGRVR